MKKKHVSLLNRVRKWIDKLITTKVSLVVIFVLFGAVLAFGVAVASGVGFSKPNPLRSSAHELDKLATKTPAYGYQNPSITWAKGAVTQTEPNKKSVTTFSFLVYAPQNRNITISQFHFNINSSAELSDMRLISSDSQLVLAQLKSKGGVFVAEVGNSVVVPANRVLSFKLVVDVGSDARKSRDKGVQPFINTTLQSLAYGSSLPIGVKMSNVEGLPLSHYIVIVPSPTSAVSRVGQLVNNGGTVYLVGDKGLLTFPSISVFNSWCFSFNEVVPANTAEQAMSQVGVVNKREQGQSLPTGVSVLKVSTCPITLKVSPPAPLCKGLKGELQECDTIPIPKGDVQER